MATLSTSDPEVRGSIPDGCAFKPFGFSYLLFAFRREVAHLTWPRSFRAVEEYSDSPLFSLFGFLYFLEKKMLEKNASATKRKNASRQSAFQ